MHLTHQFATALTSDVALKLAKSAAKNGRSVSGEIRYALHLYLGIKTWEEEGE